MNIRPTFLEGANDDTIEGLMAHEFAHVKQYQTGTTTDLARLLTDYVVATVTNNQEWLTAFETATDLQAIKRGYGNSLIAFREERKKQVAEGNMPDKNTHQYLTPQEIAEVMSKETYSATIEQRLKPLKDNNIMNALLER